jgi:hypothetical protein
MHDPRPIDVPQPVAWCPPRRCPCSRMNSSILPSNVLNIASLCNRNSRSACPISLLEDTRPGLCTCNGSSTRTANRTTQVDQECTIQDCTTQINRLLDHIARAIMDLDLERKLQGAGLWPQTISKHMDLPLSGTPQHIATYTVAIHERKTAMQRERLMCNQHLHVNLENNLSTGVATHNFNLVDGPLSTALLPGRVELAVVRLVPATARTGTSLPLRCGHCLASVRRRQGRRREPAPRIIDGSGDAARRSGKAANDRT